MNQLTKTIDGVILVNKPIGITSNNVLYQLKKILNLKKMGHCGTLDPFASGLLIICIGKATRIAQFLTSLDKQYIAEIKLGEEKDTDDLTGNTINYSSVIPELNNILDLIPCFIGEIQQTPPDYSAIKINGKRAYKLARQGTPVTLKQRKVQVKDIILIKYNYPYLQVNVTCSKGTYIRALARDIGRKLNCFAHLVSLHRTKTGSFELNDQSIFNIQETNKEIIMNKLIPIKDSLYFIPEIQVDDRIKRKISYGQNISSDIELENNNSQYYKVTDSMNGLLAIIDKYYNYKSVFHYDNN